MSSQQNKKKTIHAHTIIIFDVTLLIQNLLGFHGWGGRGGSNSQQLFCSRK